MNTVGRLVSTMVWLRECILWGTKLTRPVGWIFRRGAP